ncbi:MAG: hypothetical protein ACLR8Y_16350 [Alistipes indistinctus]
MTDELADRIASESPYDFRKLPERFRTSERLLLAVERCSKRRYYNDSLVGGEDRRLLTREVCEKPSSDGASTSPNCRRRCGQRISSPTVWNTGRRSSGYGRRHAISLPGRSERGCTRSIPDLVGYLPRRYLTPERTRKLYRKMPSLKGELPRHHFTEFSKQTGLSEEFYGGEVSFARS